MPEPTAEVTRRGLDRIRRGHLWIYRSDVRRTDDVSPGDVVRVVDGRGWHVGRALYSQTSQITLRMLTLEDVPVDEAFFAARLDAAIDLRARLYGEAVEALRLVHSEGDLLPGLVVDRYRDVVVFQTLNQGMDAHKDLLVKLLEARLSPRCIVERNDAKVRTHEGLALTKGVVQGEAPGGAGLRGERGKLVVDPLEGQKTGGFLDQRENRAAAAGYVRAGERCLDVFTYGGGFALNLAKAGGRVTAVDISDQAVAEARQAAERNALKLDVVSANAFDWLKARSVEGERFDLIVLDPPAFARNKRSLEAATRGYKEVNLRALQMLAPGGLPRHLLLQLPHGRAAAPRHRPRRRRRRWPPGADPGAPGRRPGPPGAPRGPRDRLPEVHRSGGWTDGCPSFPRSRLPGATSSAGPGTRDRGGSRGGLPGVPGTPRRRCSAAG